MRFRTKKRAKADRAVAGERRRFLEEKPYCAGCGRRCTEVHEMACGSHRAQAVRHRYTWLPACTLCNQTEFTNYAACPLERQLALKWLYDREHFDLEAFNRLRGRAPGAITMADVIPWICRELDGGTN